jgi:hypothetical protein
MKDIQIQKASPYGTTVTYSDGTAEVFHVHRLWGTVDTFRKMAAVLLVQDEDTFIVLGVDKKEDLPEVERYCRALGMEGPIVHLTLAPIV